MQRFENSLSRRNITMTRKPYSNIKQESAMTSPKKLKCPYCENVFNCIKYKDRTNFYQHARREKDAIKVGPRLKPRLVS